MTNQSYKRQKQSSALYMPCLLRRDGGQPEEGQNEQQQQQPANHSSDNAELARCLTPSSRDFRVCDLQEFSLTCSLNFKIRGLVGLIGIACEYAFGALEKESILLCKNGLRCFKSVKDE